jgi:toxin ParE1/3/4
MAEVIWTNHALADLESIANYIAQGSERYAQLTIQKLFFKTEKLKFFPHSGRMVPEKNKSTIRELIDGNYRIIYEIINENTIYILAVHHSAKLLT